MRRLWLRWTLLIAFVAVLAAVFVRLGEWQLDRLHERQARNAVTTVNLAAPIRPYEQVFTRPVGDAEAWQQVQASGTFDADRQFVVRFRGTGDTRGYQVVTPLRTPSGSVLVDRGVVPVPTGTPLPTVAPAPPTGQVTVIGWARRNENGRRGAVQPVDGQVRLINSTALAPAVGYPLADGYLSAVTVEPAQSGGLVPVTPPDLSEGPHFWYAVQWFLFTGIGVLGVVVFVRGDLRERREQRATAGSR